MTVAQPGRATTRQTCTSILSSCHAWSLPFKTDQMRAPQCLLAPPHLILWTVFNACRFPLPMVRNSGCSSQLFNGMWQSCCFCSECVGLYLQSWKLRVYSQLMTAAPVPAHMHYLHGNKIKTLTEENILGRWFLLSESSGKQWCHNWENNTVKSVFDTPRSDNSILPGVKVF